MDVRKSAVDISGGERRFLEALIRLKHRPAPTGPAGVSVYDQFVALHGAVFAVLAPGLPPGDTVNFGHWNIGFCAWHRKYLREFERVLQAEVTGVTLPYGDWSDHVGAVGTLFVAEFRAPCTWARPPLTGGVLRNPVPPAERPPWWPVGAAGFPIHPLLEAGFGTCWREAAPGLAGRRPWPASSSWSSWSSSSRGCIPSGTSGWSWSRPPAGHLAHPQPGP